MVISATPFFASGAGIVTLAYGPMIGAAIGYGFKRVLDRLAKQDSNAVVMDKAIGILVEQVAPLSDRLTIAEANINTLDKAQAVLAEHVRAHDEWAKSVTREGPNATQ